MNEPNPYEQDQSPEPAHEPEIAVEIPVAEAAPIVPVEAHGAGAEAKELLGLPLQFLNLLLQKLGATRLDSLAEFLPALRLLAIALVAGIALKITGSTLGAINEIPLVGGLLELLGLVGLLNFLARNALKQQKRAELLSRIVKLRKDFLG
ncbi:CAAD domain-containing protein [Cyanobium sp. HWJ4-Hawea]|uniref:CAAD domain-containing protein n=1 Tax=Cyanobium sp. HWJ4-Hawea TaxID=2823713 RepID=UPI0020CD0A23|nr:CAAD domain-containing protein [Cyanobium sp. HWJ4-Hawea]MCP9808991.1 CAAD domain-containing protein [Cyanobium sp. HWJ4-Hawea]